MGHKISRHTASLLLGNWSCITLLHTILGVMHCSTTSLIHMDVVNADIARSNISIHVSRPSVEMTKGNVIPTGRRNLENTANQDLSFVEMTECLSFRQGGGIFCYFFASKTSPIVQMTAFFKD